MKIHVTAKDIKRGARKDCAACPIALAILREYPHWGLVRVGSFFICTENLYVRTPREVAEFMFRFDCGALVEPFSFDIPDAVPDSEEVAA